MGGPCSLSHRDYQSLLSCRDFGTLTAAAAAAAADTPSYACTEVNNTSIARKVKAWMSPQMKLQRKTAGTLHEGTLGFVFMDRTTLIASSNTSLSPTYNVQKWLERLRYFFFDLQPTPL